MGDYEQLRRQFLATRQLLEKLNQMAEAAQLEACSLRSQLIDANEKLDEAVKKNEALEAALGLAVDECMNGIIDDLET